MESRIISRRRTASLFGCTLALLPSCALLPSSAFAQAQPLNLAQGKIATFSDAPNYSLSTDPDDAKQLTDGRYSSLGELQKVENTTSIWVQKGTVGWQKTSPLIISFDLGAVQPISGVSYSTAAGLSDVTWPRAIFILVSDDNKNWRKAGELVRLSRANGLPPQNGYANFRYVTHNLQTKGRYIAFSVNHVPYAFVDEIEVYKGDDAWLNRPATEKTFADIKDWTREAMAPTLVLNRVQKDSDEIRAAINAANLTATQKSAYTARLDKAIADLENLETLPDGFKAVLPLNPQHRATLAVYGDLLGAQGAKPITVWKQQRYQWMPLLAAPSALAPPPAQSAPQLKISMLRNQFRSDALLLTNATGKEQQVTLRLLNAPRGAQGDWLKVASVAWTDTAQSVPIADAQLPVTLRNGAYVVDVPAGMTRKVWLTVDSSKVPAGTHQSQFEVSGAGIKTTVPFALQVSTVAMPKPRMSLSTWDYTNVPSFMGLTPENRKAAVALMRSHYMDTVWATSAALPRPDATAFDAQGNLKIKIDFSNLDQWIAEWPDARRYFVYSAVGDTFAGAKIGTPEFNVRVGNWAKAIADHVKTLPIKPQQLGILLVDEPHTEEKDTIAAAWIKAVKATAPEITLFQDPIWLRPDQTKTQEAITGADLICFHIPVFKAGGEPVKEYAAKLKQMGKELWLYQATGPVRLYDPQLSYRHLAWHSYAIGGTGQGYWAFGDTGGVPTSWNEYAAAYVTYAPVFVDKDNVYNSLHWDAVREGIQDFEELSMLQDAINQSKDAAWKARAQQVLDSAVKAVDDSWDGNRDWWKKWDANLTDLQIQKVRALLTNGK